MENQAKSSISRWSIPVSIVIAALIVGAALYFGNRYYIFERKNETLVKLDRISGLTYEYSQPLGWLPDENRMLISDPSATLVTATIEKKDFSSYIPNVTIRISNKSKNTDLTYAVVSVIGSVDGKKIVGGTADFSNELIPPGWSRADTAQLVFIDDASSIPLNIEFKITVNRAAFKRILFKKAK